MSKELTEMTIRHAKPRDKKYSLSDIRGLHLDVMPSGRKFWRLRYTKSDGKKSWFTIGEYPSVTASEARNKVPYLRQRAKEGLPLRDMPEPDMTFASFAEQWAQNYAERGRTDASVRRVRSGLDLHILPYLGGKDVRTITTQDVLAVLQKLADDGKHTTLINVRTFISQIFRYAAVRGAVDHDPSSLTIGAIAAPAQRHYPTLSSSEDISRLLKGIDEYPNRCSRLGTLFAIYSLLRPGEARTIEWTDIDMTSRLLRIPAERMKMRRSHIVPLSDQLVKIIEAMRGIPAKSRYIFTQKRDPSKPMDKLNMRYVLDAAGFSKEVLSPHGFRSMASTIMNEHGFNSDWIERQLAHVEGNKVRAAYNYADFLDDRRKMLQWYADYLDELRGGAMYLG